MARKMTVDRHVATAVSVQMHDQRTTLLNLLLQSNNALVAAVRALSVARAAAAQRVMDAQTAAALTAQPTAELQFQRCARIASIELIGKLRTRLADAVLGMNNLRKGHAQARRVQRMAMASLQMQGISAQVLIMQPALKLASHRVASNGMTPRVRVDGVQVNMVQVLPSLPAQLDMAALGHVANLPVHVKHTFHHAMHTVGRFVRAATGTSHQGRATQTQTAHAALCVIAVMMADNVAVS